MIQSNQNQLVYQNEIACNMKDMKGSSPMILMIEENKQRTWIQCKYWLS